MACCAACRVKPTALGNVCGDLTMDGISGMRINGQPMYRYRIDEQITKGDTEIWRISVDEERLPFHIYGCSFRIP